MAASVAPTKQAAETHEVQRTRSSVDAPERGGGGGGGDKGDGVRLSGLGSFTSKVQSLVKADPDQAKRVLGELATRVREQATHETGQAAAHMAQFADKLQAASDTGDASALAPDRGKHGRGPERALGGHGGQGSERVDPGSGASTASAANGASEQAASPLASELPPPEPPQDAAPAGAAAKGAAEYAKHEQSGSSQQVEAFFNRLSGSLDTIMSAHAIAGQNAVGFSLVG